MDMLSWLSLAGICALGAMSPGPSLQQVFGVLLLGLTARLVFSL